MKTGLTEIVFVLDKSLSMKERTDAVVKGYKEFMGTQKELPGEAKFTLVLFDTFYNIVHNGIDIKDVPELEYKAFGCTALLDAVGRTIDAVGERLNDTPEAERPERVLFIIMTDGEENSSHKYSLNTLKEKVQHQTDVYKWEFMFLGANIDAFDVGMSLGLTQDQSYNFDANMDVGVYNALHLACSNATQYRTCGRAMRSSDIGGHADNIGADVDKQNANAAN